MSVKVTMNLKTPIGSYRQLCPQTLDGTVNGNHSVSAHSQPSRSSNWGRRLARSASRRPPVC